MLLIVMLLLRYGLTERIPRNELFLFMNKQNYAKETEQTSNEVPNTLYEYGHRRCISNEIDSCGADMIKKTFNNFQILSPKEIINVIAGQNLSTLCREIQRTLSSVNHLTRVCNLPKVTKDNPSLMKSLKMLNRAVCSDSQIKRGISKYSECFKYLKDDEGYQCRALPKYYLRSDKSAFCSAIKDVKSCYYTTITITCNDEAASIFNTFLDKIFRIIYNVNCDKYEKNDKGKL